MIENSYCCNLCDIACRGFVPKKSSQVAGFRPFTKSYFRVSSIHSLMNPEWILRPRLRSRLSQDRARRAWRRCRFGQRHTAQKPEIWLCEYCRLGASISLEELP